MRARLRGRDADQFEQAHHFRIGGGLGPVQSQGFLDLVADAKDRIEGGARFLKHITDQAAADVAQFGGLQLQDIAAFQKDLRLPHKPPAGWPAAARWKGR